VSLPEPKHSADAAHGGVQGVVHGPVCLVQTVVDVIMGLADADGHGLFGLAYAAGHEVFGFAHGPGHRVSG